MPEASPLVLTLTKPAADPCTTCCLLGPPPSTGLTTGDLGDSRVLKYLLCAQPSRLGFADIVATRVLQGSRKCALVIVCSFGFRGRAVLQWSWLMLNWASFSSLLVSTFFKILSCSVNLCARKILRPGSFWDSSCCLSLVFAGASDSFSFGYLHRLSSSSSQRCLRS